MASIAEFLLSIDPTQLKVKTIFVTKLGISLQKL